MSRKKPLIHEMRESERPREKFELYGGDKMSDAELLALILRTGSRNLSAVALAEEILNLDIPGEGLEKLYHLSKKDLMEIHGIGHAKATEILALCELSVRLSRLKSREHLSFSSPASGGISFLPPGTFKDDASGFEKPSDRRTADFKGNGQRFAGRTERYLRRSSARRRGINYIDT